MASVTFLLKSKNTPATIYVRLNLKRGSDFIKKTGLTIDPSHWSAKKKEPKSTTPQNKNLATQLNTLKLFIENKINQSEQEGGVIDADWLQHKIDIFFKRTSETSNGQSEYLLDLIDYIINTAHTRRNARGGLGISVSRVKSYRTLHGKIKEYETATRRRYKAKDINLNFERLFLSWLMDEQQYKDSYALKTMDNLKAVCNEAKTLGVEVSPQLYKLAKGTPEKELPLYLTPDELQQIKDCKITSMQLYNARKWLLLGCLLGQRGGDLLKVDESNFITLENGTPAVQIKQQKTGKTVIVPILQGVNTEILEIKKTGLPYGISLQRLNEYIKEVCKIAGIDAPITHVRSVLIDRNGNEIGKDDKGNYTAKGNKRVARVTLPKYEFITSHVCRRSFATNLYGKLPTPMIKNITGHSTETMLLNYIGKTEVDKAMQMFERLTASTNVAPQTQTEFNDFKIK